MTNRFDALRAKAAAANAVKLSYEPILPAEIFGEGSAAYLNVGAAGYPVDFTIFAQYSGMGPIVETKYGPASFPGLVDLETGAQFQVPAHTSLVKQLFDFYAVGDELAITCFGPVRDEKGAPKRSAKGAPPILWRASRISDLEAAVSSAAHTGTMEALEALDFDELPGLPASSIPDATPKTRTGTQKK